jgi:hypothetical protein
MLHTVITWYQSRCPGSIAISSCVLLAVEKNTTKEANSRACPLGIDLDGKMSRAHAPATPLRNVPREGNEKTAVWSGGSQGAKYGTPTEVSTQIAKTKAMGDLEWSQTLFNEITPIHHADPLWSSSCSGSSSLSN